MDKKLFISVLCLMASLTAGARRESVNFNLGWEFRMDGDSLWRSIDLPHDFQIEQPWDKDASPARGFKRLDAAWYRKAFSADPAWKGRRVLLDFEGIMLWGEAFLNGVKIGETNYGYLGFEADISKMLDYEKENILTVFASTKGNSRWYTGGGLYRDVHIVVKEMVAIARNGVYITSEVAGSGAKVNIQVETEGLRGKDYEIEIAAKIYSPGGQLVAETKTAAPRRSHKLYDETPLPEAIIAAPQLWSCEEPNLYRAEITLLDSAGRILDNVSEEFGIRTIEFSKEFGFKLNGKKLFLKGIANHHDLGAVGAAAHEDAIERMFILLKKFGFNHIRTSHNPYSKSFLRLADRYGILITDELYDKWSNRDFWPGSERAKWTDEVFRNLPEWIKRDRNHPSVIIWSFGNELQQREDLAGFPTSDWGVTTYRMLDVLAKRYDSTRPTTVAMHPTRAAGIGKGDPDFDVKVIPPELATVTEVASFNYRWMNYAEYLRHAPDMIVYQSEASTNDLTKAYYGMDYDKMVGLAYWGAIEYWGESNGWPKKGWAYSFFNHALEPYPQAYLIKATFSDEPEVHIGVLDKASVSEEWNEQTVGTQSVSSHWNREEGKNYNILTYTNADEVELLINGKSLGVQQNARTDKAGRNIIAWKNVPFLAGKLVAIARNHAAANGGAKEVARHAIETTGKAVALKMVVEDESLALPSGKTLQRRPFKADGMSLQYVKVYAIDSKGRVVQDAVGEVTFEIDDAGRATSLQAPAYLLAVDNGDHYSDELFAGSTRRLHSGFAMAIVRSTLTPGSFKIRATAKDLKSAEKTICLIE